MVDDGATRRSGHPPLAAGNTRVKDARRLSRRSERSERRLFLADGPNAVEAALEVPGCVVEVFATPDATERYAALADAAPAWTLVDDRAMAALSDSVTPAGVVGVCRFLDRPLTHLLDPAPALVAICADVRDPGNAGTVIRSADAAGAGAVVLAGSSVDVYNPKTVRASVGSVFHLPVAVVDDAEQAVRAAQAAGLVVLAADGGGDVGLFDAGDLLSRPTAWLFGNEAWGLPAELAALADHRVAIPIHGRAESLNLSTAAALCLYASATAQRRSAPS
ncbi:RNA methyltransferase [Nocardioides sp. cx-173]|uniref:TrmH family RNA methyltransferase n=1 Tax=Nocardioides sp. cx-173 TaxID=2898796 RepID=UPI001E65C288|nr:RNA methyltransferase [Nocardioides sp. cx-173]MCD4526118.1 RNA methyltransferase [Nocardioides sp. cx-173]UGB43807.1 RNA methyltransferase [Nocardioides sp. cx-173]